MKVYIVGVAGVPANYGGFETLVDNLIGVEDIQFELFVFCSKKNYKKSEQRARYKNAKLIYLPVSANGIQSIAYDAISLLLAVRKKADVVLVLGVSGAFFIPLVRRFSPVKIVCNIDGLEWKRQKWGAATRYILKLFERLAVNYSNVVVSDNKGITKYVKDEYGREAVTIAYGGDHVLAKKSTHGEIKYPVRGCESYDAAPYFFSLCRIEPENNIEMILESFANSGFPIKFVGNWFVSSYSLRLYKKYEKFNNISLLSPVYDTEVLFDLRKNCVAYIHGHSAGGTNPSLVEAMYFARPVIAYDCVYNKETTEGKAIYFSDSFDLIMECKKIYCRSYEQNCGEALLEIARERYNWENIRNQYFSVFSSLKKQR